MIILIFYDRQYSWSKLSFFPIKNFRDFGFDAICSSTWFERIHFFGLSVWGAADWFLDCKGRHLDIDNKVRFRWQETFVLFYWTRWWFQMFFFVSTPKLGGNGLKPTTSGNIEVFFWDEIGVVLSEMKLTNNGLTSLIQGSEGARMTCNWRISGTSLELDQWLQTLLISGLLSFLKTPLVSRCKMWIYIYIYTHSVFRYIIVLRARISTTHKEVRISYPKSKGFNKDSRTERGVFLNWSPLIVRKKSESFNGMSQEPQVNLGGGFNFFLFSPLPAEMIQFDYIMFFNWVETSN